MIELDDELALGCERRCQPSAVAARRLDRPRAATIGRPFLRPAQRLPVSPSGRGEGSRSNLSLGAGADDGRGDAVPVRVDPHDVIDEFGECHQHAPVTSAVEFPPRMRQLCDESPEGTSS